MAAVYGSTLRHSHKLIHCETLPLKKQGQDKYLNLRPHANPLIQGNNSTHTVLKYFVPTKLTLHYSNAQVLHRYVLSRMLPCQQIAWIVGLLSNSGIEAIKGYFNFCSMTCDPH